MSDTGAVVCVAQKKVSWRMHGLGGVTELSRVWVDRLRLGFVRQNFGLKLIAQLEVRINIIISLFLFKKFQMQCYNLTKF